MIHFYLKAIIQLPWNKNEVDIRLIEGSSSTSFVRNIMRNLFNPRDILECVIEPGTTLGPGRTSMSPEKVETIKRKYFYLKIIDV
jgi:hypothetical protein